MPDARQAAEGAARDAYGRLVAKLAARTRDLSAAEDALAEAFRQALESWPRAGVPDSPEAWLLTAARRVHGHAVRHQGVTTAAEATLRLLGEEKQVEPSDFADHRLKLLFVCAHPAIDPAARTPLMLQTVLGLDAARIAGAFAASPTAMAQRLVRAKAKVRDAGLRFETPEGGELPERLEAVLAAIYAAYGAGWDDDLETGLADEAIFLGRLMAELMPDEPETLGLSALMLYCEARRPARRAGGVFVPLAEQDPRLWHREMILEAEALLVRAAARKVFGRFQTEAAIQSVHCQRAITGAPNHQALVLLYDLLAERRPAVGVLVGRAAAHGAAFGPAAGLTALEQLDAERIRDHQPYWATLAHLLAQAGRAAEAATARQRAIGLTSDPAVRAYLQAQD